jgi:shikimate kinase
MSMATFRTSRPVSLTELGEPHIILVGLPGAGKSTVGRALADKLSRPFLDFDLELARREGKPVAAIFAEDGEPRFRELERLLTREIAAVGGMVVAPGSGWIADERNVAAVRPPALLVWLKVTPEVALGRVRSDTTVRPLLSQGDPLAGLRRLLTERVGYFEQADVVVDTGLLTLAQAVERVAALASRSGPG